jgi:hypothetical protein
MNKPRGISLHIGVNRCNPDHYGGWEGPLSSCENDADVMQAIAGKQGFESRQLKTEQATRDAVKASILDAADTLRGGDFLLITYSGHGGQVMDVDGDEQDGRDDTWCLYDGQLLDDELNVMFARFAPDVRILVLSDSCHSGTMHKGGGVGGPDQVGPVDDFVHSRAMPRAAAIETARSNRSFYAQVQEALPNPRPEIHATVRLLSGCQEHEQSFGNKEFGRFTHAVHTVFAAGAFNGSYKAFHREIVAAVARAMNPQTPGHALIGKANPEFDKQTPFTI